MRYELVLGLCYTENIGCIYSSLYKQKTKLSKINISSYATHITNKIIIVRL